MQFGGTPMEHSPSSTGVNSSTLLSISAPLAIHEAKASPSNNFEHASSSHSASFTSPSMFAPHPNVLNHHTTSMFSPNANSQMSNGPTANGNQYVQTNQQQSQASLQQQQQPPPPPQHPQQNQHQQASQASQHQSQTMSNGHSSEGNKSGLIYPALHLQPLNDTFAPKQISLSPPGPQNKVKIGRQTNQKTTPQPSNGYFDSKVLSRMHAEIWSQDGKVFIKDVKSSNGTFINGTRLSPEGQESDTFELHTDDVVEFGIDIVGEDNKTIIHHKVACRAFLVMTAEEALGLRHDFAALYRGGIAGSTLGHHSVGPGAEGGLRRSKLSTGTGSYGGVGPGGAMMSFDHILHKLQAELQKSRDTAGELGHLTTSMNDIGDTLSGGLPPMHNPPYQHMVPPINGGDRGGQNGAMQPGEDAGKTSADTLVKALEEQVRDTQQALNAHVDRLSGLEARLLEQDNVKMDIDLMRSQVDDARRELAEALRLRSLAARATNMSGRSLDTNGNHGSEDADFDDGASMASVDTVVPGDADGKLGNGPLGVDEIESAEISKRLAHDDEDNLDDAEALQRLKNHTGPRAPPDGVPAPFGNHVKGEAGQGDAETNARKDHEALSKRLESIENQLERALELGRTLAGQHAQATETVKRLEERVKSLEGEQHVRAAVPPSPSKGEGSAVLEAGGAVAASGGILAILEGQWGKWRDAFEIEYEKEKNGLREEREEVKRVVKMWDSLNADIEDTLESDVTEDDITSASPVPETSKAAAEEATALSPTTMSSSAKKRKRRRAAAAAAAAAAASAASNAAVNASTATMSPSTSTVGLSAFSPSSTSKQDTTARINRELRALLYTDNYNQLVLEEHLAAQASSLSADRETDACRSELEDDDGSAAGEKGGRHLGLSNLHPGSKRPPAGGGERGGGGTRAGFDSPAALPMLSVAGVIAFGMTAWVLSGGKGLHLGGGTGVGL